MVIKEWREGRMAKVILTYCRKKKRKHNWDDAKFQLGRLFELMLPICMWCEKPLKKWKIKNV